MTEKELLANGYRPYSRKGVTWATPWTPESNMAGVSVSEADILNGLNGGFIAINPENPEDRWFVAAAYAAKHWEREP